MFSGPLLYWAFSPGENSKASKANAGTLVDDELPPDSKVPKATPRTLPTTNMDRGQTEANPLPALRTIGHLQASWTFQTIANTGVGLNYNVDNNQNQTALDAKNINKT